ncbi:MAG: succinate dehydrogenase/fumarate reductase iron-sulfur subunit [Methanobacteriales archaeon HGW-Methanobacteriales-1]|jgi:succinate dehydrogenase / fumarate reductase iron-sulfur subunit|nr:MAG: succinate dehydrogenase/fumarate reductase iron-sulfur subunit [Methanobacteriales archaeon HGW-Methanobacteriales-1]
MKLKVYRYQEGRDSHTYDTFNIKDEAGMTVLKALFQIQEIFDDSLTFQYSCRGAVCGTCAMLINKVPRLACRTQLESLLSEKSSISLSHYPGIGDTVEWNPREEILVEPLPHFKVIKDLIVDRSTFFKSYKFVEPVLKPSTPEPGTERLMDPEKLSDLELYTNCILCAACFGACPVDGKNSEYLGPAALAKLYRFHIDSRDGDELRLEKADIPNGWWACEFHGNCRQVCPKGVPPVIAIGQARAELMDKKENKETD